MNATVGKALLASLFVALVFAGGAQGAAPSRAANLMKRRLYPQAIKALLEELNGVPEDAAGVQQLRLGECYYLQGKYAEARPWYAKAQRNLPPGKNAIIAEYRLACIGYRLNDAAAAVKATQSFIKKYPNDRRGGTLLLFQMKALAKQGRRATAAVESTRRAISAGAGKYGSAANMAADKILTDFYLKNGGRDKAINGYMNIVNNFRKVSAEYASSGRAVPAELEEARDYAAMQLAGIAIKGKRHQEAIKWLDSIRFDQKLIHQARLLLAQIAYEKRDYEKAKSYLLGGKFIESVPPGHVRSDMYLLLGFCAKMDRHPTMEKVLGFFGKVDPGTKGYPQSRMGMGDTAEKWRRPDLAVKYFEQACVAAKYEPEARSRLGRLYMQLAEKQKDAAKREDLYRKAGDHFSKLTKKYPSSQFAKAASEPIKELIAKGLDVKLAISDEDVIKQWQKVVDANPGTPESARALINIARMHQKPIIDEKTEKFVKAPNFEACLHACDALLNAGVYTGKGLSPKFWHDVQTEALYYRGLCRVSSIGQKVSSDTNNPAIPRYIRDVKAVDAMVDLRRAQKMVDPKQRELAKNIEIVLLEAMFKSDDEADRKAAEKRFNELIEKYGREPRFQKLAVDLAKWHHEQGNYVIAARLYRGVADRGGVDLAQEDITRLLFMSGKLYSKAAYDSANKKTARRYAIYVYPREVIQFAGLINTHKPFQKAIRGDWSEAEITAEEALFKVSKLSGIPFVWSRRSGQGSIADYLRTKKLKLTRKDGTVQDFLKEILDLEKHDLAFDIGLTGAGPTIKPDDADDASIEEKETRKIIEIYAKNDEFTRYVPMTKPYGAWSQTHKGTTMMFSIMKRIEQLSGTKARYAEGVNREDVLAAEYDELPGMDSSKSYSCAETLEALLDAQGLAHKMVQRDLSAELYEKAKDCFNEIRKIDPKSPEGEQSLFLLALNYYQQENYERMKIVLQNYLKVFDTPAFDHYHQACFWVGWTLEQEKRFRDAWRYYNRAADEELVVYMPEDGSALPEPEELRAKMSYDSDFSLQETVTGMFTNYSLEGAFLDFVRVNSGVDVRMDPTALGLVTNKIRRTFREKTVFDLLYDVLKEQKMTFRVENVDKKTAEKAYYRMAYCYKQEGLNEQALSSCTVLLDRYPKTSRRRRAIKMKLDVYKALKDYGNVLKTLMTLKGELGEEAFKIDYEIAWVYLDLCRYEESIRHFKTALNASTDPSERVKIRDGYARALLKAGKHAEALSQYRALLKEEPGALRKFIDEMLVWYLERATGQKQTDDLPPEASRIIKEYEALDEEQLSRLTRSALAKVTWIYYVTALVDLKRNDPDRALAKFDAAGNSPDDSLAADAIHETGSIHMKAKRFEAARESFEYLLFSTKAAEAEVKAIYNLALCYRELGDEAKAEGRFNRLLKKFPDSSYAAMVKEERKKKAEEEAKAKAAAEAAKKAEAEKAAAKKAEAAGGKKGEG